MRYSTATVQPRCPLVTGRSALSLPLRPEQWRILQCDPPTTRKQRSPISCAMVSIVKRLKSVDAPAHPQAVQSVTSLCTMMTSMVLTRSAFLACGLVAAAAAAPLVHHPEHHRRPGHLDTTGFMQPHRKSLQQRTCTQHRSVSAQRPTAQTGARKPAINASSLQRGRLTHHSTCCPPFPLFLKLLFWWGHPTGTPSCLVVVASLH